MSDAYSKIVNSGPGGFIAGKVGLPRPEKLERHTPGAPLVTGHVLLGVAPGGRLAAPLTHLLSAAGVGTATTPDEGLRGAAAEAGLDAAIFDPDGGGERRFKALVFDATGISDSTELVELQRFFHPTVRRVERSGRIIVLGTPPDACGSPREATAQRALEGFIRSLGKEAGRGATVQLVYVEPGSEGGLDSTLRFLLSPRSAYVSGQVIRVGGDGANADLDWEQPLAGKRALVTGASRGIGESIATVLHRDGAELVLLDVPALSEDLTKVAERLGAETIELDITEESSPAAIADRLSGGVDIVVHNAGVTRDRTIAKMPEERWSELMEINLSSEERINDALLEKGLLRKGGRVVCVSSMSGIAGNSGQTNYATSKAGVIGMVESLAPVLSAEHDATINAVAPGFIETQMTSKMPIPVREAGRRMNSVSQGGLPVDVAETIAWLACPASGAVNGNVVRVCGQSLLGA